MLCSLGGSYSSLQASAQHTYEFIDTVLKLYRHTTLKREVVSLGYNLQLLLVAVAVFAYPFNSLVRKNRQ